MIKLSRFINCKKQTYLAGTGTSVQSYPPKTLLTASFICSLSFNALLIAALAAAVTLAAALAVIVTTGLPDGPGDFTNEQFMIKIFKKQ